jgi:hypothetical protein
MWVLNMNTLTAAVSVATALSLGCAAATGPQSLPEDVRFNRVHNAHVDAGSMRSSAEVLTVLHRVLARNGYFIIRTEESTPDGYRFLTDWRARPVYADEAFAGVQRARTRLVIDARRRGTRYAVAIYAVSFLEDQAGGWQEATVSQQMRKHVRDLGTQIALDVK